jgi:hypothetical protein
LSWGPSEFFASNVNIFFWGTKRIFASSVNIFCLGWLSEFFASSVYIFSGHPVLWKFLEFNLGDFLIEIRWIFGLDNLEFLKLKDELLSLIIWHFLLKTAIFCIQNINFRAWQSGIFHLKRRFFLQKPQLIDNFTPMQYFLLAHQLLL